MHINQHQVWWSGCKNSNKNHMCCFCSSHRRGCKKQMNEIYYSFHKVSTFCVRFPQGNSINEQTLPPSRCVQNYSTKVFKSIFLQLPFWQIKENQRQKYFSYLQNLCQLQARHSYKWWRVKQETAGKMCVSNFLTMLNDVEISLLVAFLQRRRFCVRAISKSSFKNSFWLRIPGAQVLFLEILIALRPHRRKW